MPLFFLLCLWLILPFFQVYTSLKAFGPVSARDFIDLRCAMPLRTPYSRSRFFAVALPRSTVTTFSRVAQSCGRWICRRTWRRSQRTAVALSITQAPEWLSLRCRSLRSCQREDNRLSPMLQHFRLPLRSDCWVRMRIISCRLQTCDRAQSSRGAFP